MRLSFDDRDLAYYELRQDPAFPHLKAEDAAVCIDRSLAIGRDAAAPYAGQDPSELAMRLGARIVCRESSPEITGGAVRAEYDSGTHTITICRTSVAQVQVVLNDLCLQWSRITPSAINQSPATSHQSLTTALNLLIAHELFHHLEATQIGRVDRRFPMVAGRRMGPFTVGARHIGRCREIAAHSFAKELTGLPFLPNAMDRLVTWLNAQNPSIRPGR
jgi:hypothetical protein